jgi:hypothetical protein
MDQMVFFTLDLKGKESRKPKKMGELAPQQWIQSKKYNKIVKNRSN